MELFDVASEANDLRAQALYDCCHFDALLEFGMYNNDVLIELSVMLCIAGIDWQSENTTVTKAEACCTDRDVYYFDEEERFFLVSCLALWYVAVAKMAARWFVWCSALSISAGTPGRETTLLLKSIPQLQEVWLTH